MEPVTLSVGEAQEGMRLDAFLAESVEELSRSAAQKLIGRGLVLLGDTPVAKSRRCRAGEEYTVLLPEPEEETEAQPQDLPLDIVYEDDDLIVVNKAVGMVVHPAPGHADGTLVNALLYHCAGSLSGIGGEKRPGIVHRIDKDTGGLLLAAKNETAHRGLAAQLKDHSLARTYECIVVGNLRDDAGTVDAPIGRHPTDRKRMAVTERHSRSAVTHYEVIARYPGYTHLRCRLETGRTHQIRVHLAYIGHPLLGDTVYGAKTPVKGLAGQCLHAVELTFVHPRTGEQIRLSCPRNEAFEEILRKLENGAKP